MKQTYKTVAHFGTDEIIEKRSRFIASVMPVETETEALDFLSTCRQKYWDATHNVYAYILEENQTMRYSDDGEPGGTAGLPILHMLRKEGLTNLIVVVTRYFGGVLLGTGGLVHAYSKSAKTGVHAAEKIEMVLCQKLALHCAYPLLGKVQNELSKWQNVIRDEILYTESVEIPIFLPVDETEAFIASITDKTNAAVTITKGDVSYHKK